ncbi:Asp-tRNA(Asn)/Glu-tRNA(Gln) amidotransferase subunit GatC [Dehalobacter sp. DCM]|uniref:Asp-tRNA(Asn)/Glu-tRNA(Gln) amidotransferase subunit GatC n=1 Tax=Dehalobacter sp. DCM TaxID=2907827 RepID=UPI003081F0D2|nr:Asp-tRNA(Asn)/Glu-tRNA(Gln) amidotransferase subunit GatC [Dehalobacter sp. DCM]
MKLSRVEVEHVALLARLQLSEGEVELYTEQLNSILGYAEMLQKLDTDQVPPTAHAVQLYNVLREDEVKPSMSQEKVLQNAPDQEDGFFRVPRIV